jgi:hypothetical protein
MIHSFIAVFCIGFIADWNMSTMGQSALFIETLISAFVLWTFSLRKKQNTKASEFAVVNFVSQSYMPAAKQKKVAPYVLAMPSPPPSSSRNKDSKRDSNQR